MSALRSAVRIAAKQALGQHATAAAAGCAPRTGAAIATALRSTRAVPAVQGRALQARQCSSSRFLSLADDGDDKKSGSAIASGTDGSDDSSTADGADGEAREDEDGDLKLDEEADINDGGVDIDEDLDADVMQLFMENPAKWTSEKLARKFHLTKPRIEAIIYLKGEEAGFTPAEFAAKIADAKAASQARMDDDAAALARAQASGDEKEVRRLEKRARQSFEQEENEELSAHDEALLLGKDDDAFRNPDFFFLNDEFDGLPPLVRRLGKHGSTDKLYPEEALALQSMASNNVVTTLKSFAKATPDAKSKWTIALKDISKKKKPLYVRDQHQTLRLATDAETLLRTWVRRPSFFSGLKH